MKQALCLLLAVMLMLSFTACGEKQHDDETTTSAEQVTTTESGEEATTTTKADGNVTTGKSKTTATTTTTTKATAATTTQPAKLNPKTAFKFGTYTAAFFDNNTQSYRKVSLQFYEEFDTVQAGYTEFYTIEQCKKKYESWGSAFDESDFAYEGKKTVGGVTYYDIGVWGSLPTLYELTDTLIKTGDSEGDDSEALYLGAFAEFSLNQNGTLRLEKDHGVFGKKGTVYTFTAE